jgi:uncharacterized protein (DUF1697 family)
MTAYIALLRAVNVAGRNLVAMADLRALVEAQGFDDVQSLLQSGNLVFSGPRRAPAALERRLEEATASQLGVAADYFLRTAAEWQALVKANPFPEAAKQDPGHLVMLLLKQAPKPAAVKALEAAIRGPEKVAASGRQLYAIYPNGIGRSKLTTALIENKLATRCTGRNWNTVLKLAALADAATGS